jgi:hypothetical protein
MWSKVVRRTAILVTALALLAAACGGGSSGRPSTKATIQFVAPAPGETTKSSVAVQVDIKGGKIVNTTEGALTSTDGHLHVTLDGKLVSMTYGTKQTLDDVTPGPHSLQAEFVAKDHAPFTNRPKAFVRFNVAP